MIYRHLDNLKIAATFSDCGKFRYRLKINNPERGHGKLLCVIMQNPSDANEAKADKSVQFLERLIFNSGYQEFEDVSEMIIVNQFAFIQKKDFSGKEKHIGPENDYYIKDALGKADMVLIAWGKGNNYGQRKQSILEMIKSSGEKTVLETKKHPSRGSYKDFLSVPNYL